MKNLKKSISLLILSGLAAQMTGCGALDLTQINGLKANLQSLAQNLAEKPALPQAEAELTEVESESWASETSEVPVYPAEMEAPTEFSGLALREPPPRPMAPRPQLSPNTIHQDLRDIYVDTHRLGSEVLYKMSFRIPERFPNQIEANTTVKLAQFNHPGQGLEPMIVVRYGERNGIPGIVILHRKNPGEKARVVGKAVLQKGQVNHLLFHIKWSEGKDGFFRALYKSPLMKQVRSITGLVPGKNVYSPQPRILQVGIFPGLQANLDKVMTGRELLQALLRERTPIETPAESQPEVAQDAEANAEDSATLLPEESSEVVAG